MSPEEISKFKVLLIELKNDLMSTSEERDSKTATVNLDQSCTGRLSRIDALQGQAIAVAGQARAKQRLQMIEAAFQRIEEGEFGECVECGEDINPKRLEVNPTTLHCIECAS
ncbi:MAG: TraR/DksA family transcriptional regulator [Oleiphilaceae bacterium]|nr:TraR/DksA family transcriptional regulator [Oleiphilaceae bacterium]